MTDEDEEDEFYICVTMLAQYIKTYGARDLWTELKRGYPTQFNELLYYGVGMLPK